MANDRKFNELKAKVQTCLFAIERCKPRPRSSQASAVDFAANSFKKLTEIQTAKDIKTTLVNDALLTSLNYVAEFWYSSFKGNKSLFDKITRRIATIHECIEQHFPTHTSYKLDDPEYAEYKGELSSHIKRLIDNTTNLATKLETDSTSHESTVAPGEYDETLDAKPCLTILDTIIRILKFELHRFTERLPVKDDEISPDGKPIYDLPSDFFLHLNPSTLDIVQGDIGDCSLLSVLQGLCKTENGKQTIRNLFSVKTNENKTLKYVKVTLFKVRVYTTYDPATSTLTLTTKANGQISIKLDPTYLYRGNKVHQLGKHPQTAWVNLLEKAYMIYTNSKNIIDCGKQKEHLTGRPLISPNVSKLPDGKYHLDQAANATYPVIASTAITGKKATMTIKYTSPYDAQPQATLADLKTFDIFDKALKKNAIVTFCSSNASKIKSSLTKCKITPYKTVDIPKIPDTYITPSHSYSLLKVDPPSIITLLNPHNSYGVTILEDSDNNQSITYNTDFGKVCMNLPAFKRYFEYYSISKTNLNK